ncbi:MAG TPA: hypothetical protein VM364_06160 [Vicinamibacterales bacterium]|nr:hypothetical protein [Vicinamibacterales bacterium]
MRRILLLACALTAAACTAAPDLKQALQVTDLVTGWYDAGIVDGKNKLVPSASFRLRNTSDSRINGAALNIVFRFAGSSEEHDSIFVQRVPFEGNETQPVTVRSQTGYTGDPPQSRADMLKHSDFRDMEVVIFVRQSASQWVELHRAPVERQLLTR